jgi:hypothetical protein
MSPSESDSINQTKPVIYTVHKVNPKLLPMECIPETQFLIRSKIDLGMLL